MSNIQIGNVEVSSADYLAYLKKTSSLTFTDNAQILVLGEIITQFEASNSPLKVEFASELTGIKSILANAGVKFV